MTRSPRSPDLSALLRAMLGDDNAVLPFAEAVVSHLTTLPAAQAPPEEVLARVVAILEAVVDESNDETPAATLAAHPELLASFFQNADLLDPSIPESDRVAHLVLESLERLGGSA
jgi:hypothetical protein